MTAVNLSAGTALRVLGNRPVFGGGSNTPPTNIISNSSNAPGGSPQASSARLALQTIIAAAGYSDADFAINKGDKSASAFFWCKWINWRGRNRR